MPTVSRMCRGIGISVLHARALLARCQHNIQQLRKFIARTSPVLHHSREFPARFVLPASHTAGVYQCRKYCALKPPYTHTLPESYGDYGTRVVALSRDRLAGHVRAPGKPLITTCTAGGEFESAGGSA